MLLCVSEVSLARFLLRVSAALLSGEYWKRLDGRVFREDLRTARETSTGLVSCKVCIIKLAKENNASFNFSTET